MLIDSSAWPIASLVPGSIENTGYLSHVKNQINTYLSWSRLGSDAMEAIEVYMTLYKQRLFVIKTKGENWWMTDSCEVLTFESMLENDFWRRRTLIYFHNFSILLVLESFSFE